MIRGKIMVKLYDKRLIDSKAKRWISYEPSTGNIRLIKNIYSMIFYLIWKRKSLASMSIVDTVIMDNKPLLNSMIENIILTYLETCYNNSESEVDYGKTN